MAKYFSKNIAVAHVGEDIFGIDTIDSATRVRAWALNRNIHQFHQLREATKKVSGLVYGVTFPPILAP